MKKTVLIDEETKDIDVSLMNDLSTAYLYLQLRGIEKDGYLPVLVKHPYLEIKYIATKEKTMQMKRIKHINCFGEDSRDIEATLDKFRTTTPSRKKAFKLAKDIVEGDSKLGLYIHSSDFQIGKTYLANAITNALVDKGMHGSFLFTPSMARQAKEFDQIESRIRTLNESDLLVIDDIGAEHRSTWFRNEVLMPLLQHRLANKKLTIFTSNYSIEELENLYGPSVDTRRLTTRILELAEVIHLDDSA